jgi:hypothetical protein
MELDKYEKAPPDIGKWASVESVCNHFVEDEI